MNGYCATRRYVRSPDAPRRLRPRARDGVLTSWTMKKDFQTWHHAKAQIDEKDRRVFFHEREIWFCHLGVNIGFEQDGKGESFGRPVVVFRKFNNEV